MKKVARISIDNKPYLVFRDTTVDGRSEDRGFGTVITRLVITDVDEHFLGCLVFYDTPLSKCSWQSDEKTKYCKDNIELALANMLPHLPFGIEHIRSIARNSSNCGIIKFCDQDGFSQDKRIYFIKLTDGFLKTAQGIVFNNKLDKKSLRKEVLQILLNAFEENPDTYLSLDDLEASIPLTTKDLLVVLHLLKEDEAVTFITQPSDTQKIVSVKIRAKGIKELEGETETNVQSPYMVKNVYGTNIENTTYGTNSPITVNIEEIETVFEALQKEIKENANLENKEEVAKTVKQLEEEIKQGKNPNKTKQLLDNIKISADWVYKKIINNPIISGILVELLMRTI